MSAPFLRLVAVNGAQIAPVDAASAPKPRICDEATREDREIMLAIIKEHLGHITHSMGRIQYLTKELEESLGISLPEYMPHSLPERPGPTSPPDPLPLQHDSTGFHHEERAPAPVSPLHP
jgi:hypothetical protein